MLGLLKSLHAFIRGQCMGLAYSIRCDGNFLIRPGNHELPCILSRHHFNRATEYHDVGLLLRHVDLQHCISGLSPGMQCLDVMQATRCVHVYSVAYSTRFSDRVTVLGFV